MPVHTPEPVASSARVPRTLLVVVATITDGATGGAELQARYLAEAWAARGHRVHVVPIQMKRQVQPGSDATGTENAKTRKGENAKSKGDHHGDTEDTEGARRDRTG